MIILDSLQAVKNSEGHHMLPLADSKGSRAPHAARVFIVYSEIRRHQTDYTGYAGKRLLVITMHSTTTSSFYFFLKQR